MSESSGIGTVTEDSHDNQIPPRSDNNGNELSSKCANCRKAFDRDLEKFTEIVGKYPKKLCRFDRDERETEKNKELGDAGSSMPMNDFTVGVLEAILTIFGLPLEMDDIDEGVDKLGWNSEGPAALCGKCHEALTSFYNAFQEYVRLVDKASHVSKCVKTLNENGGRLREGKEGEMEVKSNAVPKKRGRKPKRRPEMATEMDRKAMEDNIKTEIEIVVDLNEVEFEGDEYGGDELPPSKWDNEPDTHSELGADSYAAPSETDSRPPPPRTSPRRRKVKREPEFETISHHRPRRVAAPKPFEEPEEDEPSAPKPNKVKPEVAKKNAEIHMKTTTSSPGSSKKHRSKPPPVEDNIGTFMCKHCDERFLSEMRLDKHLATAHQKVSAQGKCTVCDHYFPTVAALAKHIHSRHDKKYPCPHPDCPFSCVTHPELETHFQGAHDQPLNLCRECGKSFTSVAYLHRHRRNAHKAEISGSETDDSADDEENPNDRGEPGERLKNAGQAIPGEASSSGRHQCSQCDKSYKKKHQLSTHMLFHTETEARYGCSKCHRKYFYPKGLRRHLLVHTMSNPLACNECGNVFVRRDHLKRHKDTIHNANRVKKVRKRKEKVRHRCGECDKTFSRKEYLTLHMRIHTGEKPYMCPTCGKTFGDPRNCSQHIITHNNERPFCCSICGLTFKRAHHLHDHEGTHKEDIAKPFLCSIPDCGKTFRLRKHLVSHELVHKGSRDHACHVCGKAFNRRDNLRQHINKVHGKDLAADALQLLLNPVTSTPPSSSAASLPLPQDHLKTDPDPDPLASILIGTSAPTPTTTASPQLTFTTML